ncbi:MAG TPA: CPBP family intramembrane glutamic endopeptidase [Polyangia bacterium]
MARLPDTLVRRRGDAIDRAAVLAVAVGLVLLFRHVIFQPWYWRLYQPWWGRLGRGEHLLVGHVLVWSLPMAIVAWLVVRVLVQSWRLQPLSLTRHWQAALVDGVVGGLAASALAIVAALMSGMHFHWHPDAWAMAGNLFSNFYEELFYRGLVFAAGWYATGSALAGAAVSGWAFGYTHSQFAMPLRVLTGVVGALWSWAYARTGNLLAPYVAHELSDIILDAIL